MSPIVGALATVILGEDEDGFVWVRYGNGTAGFLSPADGPDVDVGSVLLVSMDDGSFIEAPLEIFQRDAEVGSIATISLAVSGEPYWVRYAAGGYGPLDRHGGPEVAVGDVVLVSGSTFKPAPAGLVLPPKSGIGVVRRVEDSRSLVETDHTIIWLRHDGVVDWKEWSTVELSEFGVVKELQGSPLRYHDNPPASTAIQSRFRVDSSKINETFDAIEGLDGQIAELRQIIDSMRGAETQRDAGMLPIRGVLLAGESGTGKTMLARALANEVGGAYFHVRGPEISSKWINESEEMLRALMDEADSLDQAIVFFDEIDSLGSARSTGAHEMSNKLITQFLALLDGFDDNPGKALIVGATNRPEALDPTMLRSGRFDRRINFELPNATDRAAILRATKPDGVVDQIDIARIAVLTETWCSADLRALWTRASQFARSENRTRILELDCEVAIHLMSPQIHARRAQILD